MHQDQKRLTRGSSAVRTVAVCAIAAAAVLVGVARPAGAGQAAATAPAAGSPIVSAAAPPDYVIGPDDLLTVVFWRDKDLTTDATVRPDGKISLPLIGDIQAAGERPEQLRLRLIEALSKFVQSPAVSVQVKAINSRRVFIVGAVAKPGGYQLSDSLTVVQLIAMAGGLTDFARRDAKIGRAHV